jgi:hypothetical protein
MPIYEPEDFDKIVDPEHAAKAKKEFLAKRARLAEQREREIRELEESYGFESE